MADKVFNIAHGAWAEKVRDDPNKLIFGLMTANEAEADLADHDDLSALFGAAGNTEKSDGGYARKTAVSTTLTVNDTDDRVELDIADQTFASLSGTAVVKSFAAHEESAAESGRIPLSHHDTPITPDGTDVNVTIADLIRSTTA